MKKTFLTSKTREELIMIIEDIRENYSKYVHEKTIFLIRFVGKNKIRVSNGRAMTYWKLNLDVQGEITVNRCTTAMDWFMVLTLAVIDMICAFLILYDRFSFNGILFLLGLIFCEFIPLYYLYVISPIKKIERFINKYLGGY